MTRHSTSVTATIELTDGVEDHGDVHVIIRHWQTRRGELVAQVGVSPAIMDGHGLRLTCTVSRSTSQACIVRPCQNRPAFASVSTWAVP